MGKDGYICKYLTGGQKVRGVSVGYSFVKPREKSINLRGKPGLRFFKLLFLKTSAIEPYLKGVKKPVATRRLKIKKG